MDRRALLRTGLYATTGAFLAGPALAAEPDITFVQDFDELWTTLRDRYCFFAEKRTDWARVRALYRPMAAAAETEAAFTEVVRRVLGELYDAHTHLSSPPDGAPRWPLYDLMVARVGREVTVQAVQEDSAAADAGIGTGDVIMAMNGTPIDTLAREHAPRCLTRPDPQAENYALNVTAAGHRNHPRRITVRRGSAVNEVALPLRKRPEKPDVEWRRLDGNIGYVAIRSFADSKVAEAFDAALLALKDTDGLILDVRYNGGGDTAVARPIMGRFISETKHYAQMRRRDGAGLGPAWIERVAPQGPFTYTRPVVVLANHWSASMAEGFPMGMRGIGRARIVGTPMMGLGAAVFPIRLDRTGIAAQYSGEPVYDVQGHPRWKMRPDIEVPEGDDILAAGLWALRAS